MNPNREPTILLVEDNEDIREGLYTLLESEGYSVTQAGTAEDGLALLSARSFHLIITDYMLPGQNGRWMLEQARKAGRLQGSGVLMITAHPHVTTPPGVRLLHKPLDVDEFLHAVAQALAPARILEPERIRRAAP